jgi:hypothetical protein
MTSTLHSHETFRIHVTAAAPAARLAILSIAGILGIEPQQAADRLASLPTVLADDVAPPVARRLSAVLAALGMQVRLDPTLSLPMAQASVDVALQPTAGFGPASATRVAQLVALEPSAVAAEMARPGGLVLRGMSEAEAETLRRGLRRDAGVRLLQSAGPSAIYDAWRRPGEPVPVSELIRLGLGGEPATGAVATGLNASTARHLARRLGRYLLIVNRDFQRFDLRLVGSPGVDPADLRSFLAGRAGGGSLRPAGDPGLIDRDLSHGAMRQFAADYAAIGLVVRAELRGLARPVAQRRKNAAG